jgi:hypothetical protein
MEINIDFDGTCVTHDFPIGTDIGSTVLKKLVANGHKLIFTMRSDKHFIRQDGSIDKNGLWML